MLLPTSTAPVLVAALDGFEASARAMERAGWPQMGGGAVAVLQVAR